MERQYRFLNKIILIIYCEREIFFSLRRLKTSTFVCKIFFCRLLHFKDVKEKKKEIERFVRIRSPILVSTRRAVLLSHTDCVVVRRDVFWTLSPKKFEDGCIYLLQPRVTGISSSDKLTQDKCSLLDQDKSLSTVSNPFAFHNDSRHVFRNTTFAALLSFF